MIVEHHFHMHFFVFPHFEFIHIKMLLFEPTHYNLLYFSFFFFHLFFLSLPHFFHTFMPNVFSKLALQEWGLSMVPHVMRLVRGYGKHRITIQRSILFLLIFRSLLSMRQLVKAFKKSNSDPASKKRHPAAAAKSKKVEVTAMPLNGP